MASSTLPPQSSAADLGAVPIAVRPHDSDSVFLSKTIVSLQDVFTNTLDSRFDLSPLPMNRTMQHRSPTYCSAATDPITVPQPTTSNTKKKVTALPFSGGSQLYVASAPRVASSDTTRVSVQHQQQEQQRQYDSVVQITNAQYTAQQSSMFAKSVVPSAPRMGWPSNKSGESSPQLLVVPLDAYHLLLSFRDIEVAAADNNSTALSRSTNVDGSKDGFAAAARSATSSVGKLSADAPGPRPPRSGVSVVRRIEGEMRNATSFTSSATYTGISNTADADENAVVYPTLSRVAAHLPFSSFDGWVRDYTVYGLSRNATALRTAWANKVHERDGQVYDVVEDDYMKSRAVNAKNNRNNQASEVMCVRSADAVIEIATDIEAVGEASVDTTPWNRAIPQETKLDNSMEKMDENASATSNQHDEENSDAGERNVHDGERVRSDNSVTQAETPVAAVKKRGVGFLCEGTSNGAPSVLAADGTLAAECVLDSVEAKDGDEMEDVKKVSPSLERLNCSSTTASSSSQSLYYEIAQEKRTNTDGVGAEAKEQPTAAAAVNMMETAEESTPHAQQHLWSEERRREAVTASRLTHRFIVSDAIQHAIWAIAVNLPSMEVRVVAPAEFYTLEEESTYEDDEEQEQQGAEASDTYAIRNDDSSDTRNSKEPSGGNTFRLPRKKPATEVTQAHVQNLSSALRSDTVAAKESPRSPSPAAPQPSNPITETDKERGGGGHHNVSPSPPSRGTGGNDLGTSLQQQRTPRLPPHAAECSTDDNPECRAFSTICGPRDVSASHSRSRRTRRGGSSKSASPSVALAEAVPTPLMGGARGFVDGHFSVARFNAPGALCWRVEEGEDDDKEDRGDSAKDKTRRKKTMEISGSESDPLRDLHRRSCCSVLFISDVGNCAIRYANFHNRLVRTIAGMDGVPGYRDGSCVSSLLRGATAMAWSSAGLLFTDGPNNAVRLITHVGSAKSSVHEEQTVETVGKEKNRINGALKLDAATVTLSQNEEQQHVERAFTPQSEEPLSTLESAAGIPHPACSETVPPNEVVRHNLTEAREKSVLEPLCATDATSRIPAPCLSTAEVAIKRTVTQDTAKVEATLSPDVKQSVERSTSGGKALLEEKTAHVVPRVWTLAGCVPGADGGAVDGAAYVDSSTASRACFGYLSDMSLWADETGNAQLFVLDQTHHAVRVLNSEGGVSTYVGPLDYAPLLSPRKAQQGDAQRSVFTASADALPPGLVFPSSFAMTALIKERSPALIDNVSASMLTPQPYLYSSTPVLFIASAATAAVSVLLPISQRSELMPWNAAAAPQHDRQQLCQSTGETTANTQQKASASSVLYEQISSALLLGIATEGRRTIGEATAPSLKNVVVGWESTKDDDEAGERNSVGPHRHHDDVAADTQTRRLLRSARVQQALLYLRLRFPWVLPPAVLHLSPRLVSACVCHVSGKRHGTSARRHPSALFVPRDTPLYLEQHAGGRVGVSSVPRFSRSVSKGIIGSRTATNTTTTTKGEVEHRVAPPVNASSPQQLLFRTPPRHPVVSYTQSMKDPRIAAAAREVANLLFVQPSVVPVGPRMVEVEGTDEPISEEEEQHADSMKSDHGEIEKEIYSKSLQYMHGEDVTSASEMPDAQQICSCSKSSGSSTSPDQVGEGESRRRDEEEEEQREGDGRLICETTGKVADENNKDADDDADVEEGKDERPTSRPCGAATHKWLQPPTKSLSRSPVNTPRRSSTEEATQTESGAVHESVTHSTPSHPSQSSYAAKFHSMPPEQRQLRLLQTLEQSNGAAAATPHDLSISPSPRKVASSNDNKVTSNDEHEDNNNSPTTKDECVESPTSLMQRSSLSSSRHRHSLTPSRSPNNSNGHASPPLTPRSMAAHKLMQRRNHRTSRSNTAPHVPSVGSTAGATSKRPSQEQEAATLKRQDAPAVSLKGTGGAVDSEGEGIKEDVRHEQRDRSPSHTVHEAGEITAVPSVKAGTAALVRPVKLPSLHDAYDAAVRRLFRVYAYFATKTVTQVTALTAVKGIRQSPRVVEHFSMSFSAFYRFLTLTGYLDYIADIAATAAGRTKVQQDSNGASPQWSPCAASYTWTAHLTQVQRRRAAAETITAATRSSTEPVSFRKGSTHFPTAPSARFSTSLYPRTSSQTLPSSTAAIQQQLPPSVSSSSVHPLLLLPLAVSDTRAVADVLYRCGVRTQGYHVVTCMDFQSFRRAMLLLRTWAVTAWAQHSQRWQRGNRGESRKGDGELLCAHEDGEDDSSAAAFAYLDRVPSLDALPAEDVVEAYMEVYAQAVRTVPALQPLDSGKKKKRIGMCKEGSLQISTPGCTGADFQDTDQPPSPAKSPYARSFGRTTGFSTSVSTAEDSENRHRDDSKETEDGSGEEEKKQKKAVPYERLRLSVDADGEAEVAGGSAAVNVAAVITTPPVSPISHANNGDDISCVFNGIHVHEDAAADNEDTGSSSSSKTPIAEAPPYLAASALAPEERLALDDLLQLLQRNETTLRQLFEAYSVPVVVHRSHCYTPPHSAAAAAAVSNPCSLLLGDSRSFCSKQASRIAPSGGGMREKAWVSGTSSPAAAAPPISHQRRQQQQPGRLIDREATTPTPRAATPAEMAFFCVSAAVPSTRQDMMWKVQQLYTMSSLESKEVYARTSRTMHVVPYKLFVELWRTLDVFPALMTATATQQAYFDAVTGVLLRGNGSVNAAAATASSFRPSSATAAVTGVKANARAKAARDREVEALLFTHTGLTYPCFVESFVRVAMTVFSHEVDRVAYPTSAAKATGLMQWCNKQVCLGLVEQRAQKRLHNAAAAVGSGKRGHRLSTVEARTAFGEVGSRRNSAGAATASAALLATRVVRSPGMFPDHLHLFHVPSTQKRA